MGDEIFSVYLTPADYSKLAYAKLDLPASPWKLLDAMDKRIRSRLRTRHHPMQDC